MSPSSVVRRRPVFGALREAVLMGLESIRAYKMRAGLTILGVVMGIMTVTGMSSIVAGLNASMASQIEGFGSSVIFVRPQAPGENLSRTERRRRHGLNGEEVRAILERSPAVRAVAPLELLTSELIKYGNQRVQDAQLLGTTADYEIVHSVFVQKGRFLSPTDVSRGSRVVVIGEEVRDALFPAVDPIDKDLTIDGLKFRVVGVLEHQGRFLGFHRDNVMLLPLGAYQKRDPNFKEYVADIQPVSAAKIDLAIEQVREALRRERKLKYLDRDTFGIFTQDTLTDLYRQLTSGIYLVMIAISSIGLVVGGVGVMNIMLVSVTERTREIGVRKALGAKRADILGQFLTEAMTLTGAGGLLGIAIGGLVAWLVNAFSPFPAVLQVTWVLISFATSMGVGLTFGLWPAWKAARLDPVVALRYE
jgi:putative ABC transport system permease protein